jgi:hypothetical protein
MYAKPEMLNNMRRNMPTTGITLYPGRLSCIVALPPQSYLPTMSHELMAIIPSKRDGIFDLDLIP